MSGSNLHIAWARLFLRGLATAGVREVVISPGSRSTPLVLAAAMEPSVRCHVIVDERSAGFFALGQARVTGRPTVLICTSGTAGAHYLPAVMEARYGGIPLIAVTADRPWEAYDCGSSQTVDQVKLYGQQVQGYFELGLPDASPTAMRAVVRIAAQAVHRSRWPVPGPVHVNARFRKPLEPARETNTEPWQSEWECAMTAGAPTMDEPKFEPSDVAVERLARRLAQSRRPVIACGPSFGPVDGGRLREGIATLARRIGAPIFAEATSQVRFGLSSPEVLVCGAFDALLRDHGFRSNHVPDAILEVGMPPVSSGYASWLDVHRNVPRFVVAPYGWHDPWGTARAMVFGDPVEVVWRLVRALETVRCGPSEGWLDVFCRAERRAWACVASELESSEWTEGSIAHCIVESVPPETVVVVGNSNPVRDLDTYCAPSSRSVTVLHQRGASGIDGLVSAAAGTRSVCDRPVVLLLGDLSLLHDVTGLNAARRVGGPLVVVVVQNQGGRIFEQLPIGDRPELSEVVEEYFVAPQGLDFSHAAEMFGVKYRRVHTTSELTAALREGLSESTPWLVEALVNPREGVRRRKELWRKVSEELQSL